MHYSNEMWICHLKKIINQLMTTKLSRNQSFVHWIFWPQMYNCTKTKIIASVINIAYYSIFFIFHMTYLQFKITLRAGFEPTREDPIGFQVQRLNHSAIAAAVVRLLFTCDIIDHLSSCVKIYTLSPANYEQHISRITCMLMMNRLLCIQTI